MPTLLFHQLRRFWTSPALLIWWFASVLIYTDVIDIICVGSEKRRQYWCIDLSICFGSGNIQRWTYPFDSTCKLGMSIPQIATYFYNKKSIYIFNKYCICICACNCFTKFDIYFRSIIRCDQKEVIDRRYGWICTDSKYTGKSYLIIKSCISCNILGHRSHHTNIYDS